ncbi:glycosyltransferase [Candidatus Mesenet endosymbiont of Agriotes lineatus]|uniref:glycosyltransferase n=1 Tax=Candidatus Mesenet endosymbiont of Agriotes lineatus TaxID=3077948 RepID=UPI0030CED3DD
MSDIIFIWLGGPLLEEYLVNISNYSKVFSDFQVELIVNDSSLHLLRKKQLVNADLSYYDILLKRGIEVIHYQEVIKSIKEIYRGDEQLLENLKKLERIILTEENGLHNYAAASDIIRGIRLLKGGIYIDLDVILDTKLAQQNIKELEKLLLKCDQQYPKLVLSYFALNEKNMVDSYIISAPKNSEVVKKFLDYVVVNYRITKNVILFTKMGSETSKFSLLDIK